MLMFAGIAAVLITRGERPLREGTRGWAFVAPLLAMLALSSVTDETSAALLGVCLAIAWLVDPFLIAPSRRGGALLLAVTAAAFVVVNVLLAASLSAAARSSKWPWSRPAHRGCSSRPCLCLMPRAGSRSAPTRSPSGRSGSRWRRSASAAPASRAAPSQPRADRVRLRACGDLIAGLTFVEINHAPPESHRFLTAALFMFPVFAVLALDWWPPGTFRRVLVLAALLLGGFSTILWLSHFPRHPTPETYFRQRGENLHETNCRDLAAARFGQTPELVYVESSIFYAWIGCRPSFIPGFRSTPYWVIKLKPTLGVRGLRQIDRRWSRPAPPCPPSARPDADRTTSIRSARSR